MCEQNIIHFISNVRNLRFWCRLYVYPQIVLFSTGYVARAMLPQANFYFLFNVMLWLLQGLNLYWFHFILALVYRIVTGQARTVEDTREYKDDVLTANGHPAKGGGGANNKSKKQKIRYSNYKGYFW